MTTIGLIGSGHIGSTVARLAVDARPRRGAQQLPRPRDPDRPRRPSSGRGRGRPPAPRRPRRGDIVVVTDPAQGLPRRAGRAARAARSSSTRTTTTRSATATSPSSTTGRRPQPSCCSAHLPASQVVKAFNHIYAAPPRRACAPAGDPSRRALVIAGDDAAAKRRSTEFLDSIGFDAVDVGPLAEGWRIQRGHPGLRPALRRSRCGLPRPRAPGDRRPAEGEAGRRGAAVDRCVPAPDAPTTVGGSTADRQPDGAPVAAP